jgi:hypothetical protein
MFEISRKAQEEDNIYCEETITVQDCEFVPTRVVVRKDSYDILRDGKQLSPDDGSWN